MIYTKIRGGYVRYTLLNHKNTFIFNVLGDNVNRNTCQKIYQRTFCRVVGHMKSDVCIEKGFTNNRGAFEIALCKVCKCKVLFYEGGIE